jgi:hypothetical protein
LYEQVFHRLLDRCQTLTVGRRRKPFRFKNPLVSLDATVIDLCASRFDWAQFQRTKGAVKLHLLLDHDGYLPAFACVTEGKASDLSAARKLQFPPGTIVVFDRGFNDYDWFVELTDRKVFFVTRLKDDANVAVLETLPLPPGSTILSDQIIRLHGLTHRGKPGYRFRRIEIEDPDQGRLVFLTNHVRLAAATIADIYRQRWRVEIFFKALKQNLKIKTFVGVTANALKTQVWTALIAMLILRYLQLKSSSDWSLSNLAALLRINLFVHRDLWAWLNEPFESPPKLPQAPQGALPFA